jgi:L,D-transpeptidase-like protein/putative peptidoglycan binding protein
LAPADYSLVPIYPPLMKRALIAAGLVLIFAASAVWSAPALAAQATEITLEQSSADVSYGDTLVLVAHLTAGGQPLSGRSVSLHAGATVVNVSTTNSKGDATFRVEATGNQTYEVRFGATAPGDVTAYLPSISKSLNFVLGPTVSVKLSSPLHAGRKVVGVPGVKVRASGHVTPFVAGAQVTVRVTRNGKEVKRKSTTVTKSGSDGRFKLSFAVSKRGAYRVSAVQAATGGLGSGRSSAKRLFIVQPHAGPGASGTAVRALKSRLKKLGYLISGNGTYDSSTGRAVLAFRKVFGMSRVTVANKAVFKRLAKGGGRFRVRYPKAGRHAEFDWSRQVLVLARGSRPVKILTASSGKPSTPTVFGNFHFYSKSPGFNAKGMYYSNYFVGGYAIHGYVDVPVYPASHGCIRIPIPSAISVYKWIRLGNAIYVYK